MAPKFLVDAERNLRDVTIRDKFRFYLVFKLKGLQYKRWFASTFERNCYRDFNVPDAEVVEVGELPQQLEGLHYEP